MKDKPRRQNESGNVMLYILIAIVLLAALSFAISQSGRGNMGNVTRDRQQLSVSELLQYADAVKKAVQILRLRGIGFSQLDFDDPGLAGHDNVSCTSGDCKIFDATGGGVVYKEASAAIMTTPGDWIFAANNEVNEIGTTTGTSAGADLIMILQPLKKDTCIQINETLHVPNNGVGGDPPDDTDIDITVPFTGTESYDSVIGDEGAATALGRRLMAACFREVSSGNYTFYQVLWPR